MDMAGTAATTVIEVSGVQWASTKSVAEAVLSRGPGVLAVNSNPVSQTATITYDVDRTSVAELTGWVRACGYHCAGRSVPDHLCDPMAEPGPPLPARINNHGAAERASFVTGGAGVDELGRAGDLDPRGNGDGDWDGSGGARGAGQHRTPQ